MRVSTAVAGTGGQTGAVEVGWDETRLERSERYWHQAAEAFHSAFMANNEETRAALIRLAMAWASLANELEVAEASLYWASGRPSPLASPVRPKRTENP